MRNSFKDSRVGLIVALGVLLVALWLVVAYGAYEDAKRAKYEVSIRPGAVTYGTRSTAVIPMVSTPTRHSVPMISGGTIRSYAHYGHATMPSTTSGSGYRLHTTSSATVHSIGSGGGGGGGVSSSPSGGWGGASRGINYGSVSYSMPSFALATPLYTTVKAEQTQQVALAAAPGRNGRVRRVHDNGDGGYDGDYNGEKYNEQWWSEEDEEWVDNPFEGAIEVRADGTYKYVGVYGADGHWEKISDAGDPGVPVGATPWLLMLLLVGAYSIVKTMHKKQNAI